MRRLPETASVILAARAGRADRAARDQFATEQVCWAAVWPFRPGMTWALGPGSSGVADGSGLADGSGSAGLGAFGSSSEPPLAPTAFASRPIGTSFLIALNNAVAVASIGCTLPR